MTNISKYLPTVARLFLGLVFTVFGLNFFLHFLPMPPAPPAAASFMGALFASGYVLPVVKTVEVLAGVMLLGGLFVPLALTLLAPIVVNILGFHMMLAPSGMGIPLAVLAAEVYLAWTYRESFAPMLRARTALPRNSTVRVAAQPARAAV